MASDMVPKKDRIVPGYTRVQITPEIDLFETINGKMQHTVHYGYDNIVYRRKAVNSSIERNDDD
jgi:hypothetical protein